MSTTAPDPLSAAQPFVQSNGLLLQGLTGTPSAYLWGLQSTAIDHTDHIYQVGKQPPVGYSFQGTLGYIDDVSSAGTAALTRYVNGSGHHYYSAASDPPPGFSSEATVGYVHTASGTGLVALYRHHNSGNGDYLLSTSASPPSGYVLQATVGYIHTSGGGVGGTLQNLGYDYDPAGNLTIITDSLWSGARSFQYDDLNRLREASGTFGVNQAPVTQDYVYDALGNILYKAGVYYCYGYMANCSDNTKLYAVKSTTDGNTYTYDANGNVLSGAGRTFTWNDDNRMDVVNGPGSAVMSYDYTGIRIKKTGTSGTTLYPFTGYEIVGGTVTKYIRLGNEIIASKQGSSRSFYHNDHLGGVNVISNDSGARVQFNEYDPWGKVVRSEGNIDPNHRFTGQELDPESGIHYYGGRYYDQALGRFISPDPFIQEPENPQTLNRYSYVINNPQIFIDPTGYFYDPFDDGYDSGVDFDYGFGDSGSFRTPMIHLSKAAPAPSPSLFIRGLESSPISSGFDPYTGVLGGMGLASITPFEPPGSGGLRFGLYPNGWTPAGGTTSSLFLQDSSGKVHLRLDEGWNIRTGSSNVHWNQKGTLSLFGVHNHTVAQPAEVLFYKSARGLQLLGPGMMTVGLAFDSFSIINSPEPTREVVRAIGGWTGAYAGAKAFGAAGAIAGTAILGPGPGTALGAVGGAIFGGGAGYWGGSKAALGIYSLFNR